MKISLVIGFLATIIALVYSEPPVPQSQYLPPTNRYLPPQQQQQPQNTYQAPPQQPSNNYLPPKSQYGAPAVTAAIFPNQNGIGGYSDNNNGGGYGNGRQNNGYGNQGDENYGPAKYEFQYDVQDIESGNDFGHMESRDGDKTVGRYYVLLPDGRKQIVNYEADENGYRPQITYEETGNGGNNGGRNGFGGYDRNAQSTYNNGY
ncbi:pro-resilin [Condylostylus longicornis]|uniref:pro-resilin n=1 Tax=Condylostylus longicornis TaxID=2530218 RepID=UPI00244E5AA1|nr:pro-resilin [Condylostylus longicornis]